MKFIHYRGQGEVFAGFINIQNDDYVRGVILNFYYYRVYMGWYKIKHEALFMIKKINYDD